MDNKNNSGDYNSGYCNSGNCNSGDCNSGNRNSGDCNSGNRNSGDYNSGYCNSGNCNSGDCNSGMFNTNEPKMRLFNNISEYTYTEFCNKFGYQRIILLINRWINNDNMSDEEKNSVKGWEEMGGYLKILNYKEAWKIGWNEATEEQKDWYKNLPNFDASIFKKITGIDVENTENSLSGKEVEVKIDGKEYKAIIK